MCCSAELGSFCPLLSFIFFPLDAVVFRQRQPHHGGASHLHVSFRHVSQVLFLLRKRWRERAVRVKQSSFGRLDGEDPRVWRPDSACKELKRCKMVRSYLLTFSHLSPGV